jgi:hypothetical protein
MSRQLFKQLSAAIAVSLMSYSNIALSATPLQLHASGRVANLIVSNTQYANYMTDMTFPNSQDITKQLYQYFKDDFDFIFLVTNETNMSPNITYMGVNLGVKNDTQGLGANIYDNTKDFGSAGRLQNVLHFPARRLLKNGPSLHEIAHRWGNNILPTSMSDHWGFSSVGGQLGGFVYSSLTNLGNNTYKANNGTPNSTGFGEYANGGNSLPYGELELYLMGLIPASQVKDIYVAINPAWSADYTTFTASGFDIYPISKLIQQAGARVPDSTTSQKAFRGIVVALSKEPLTEIQWQELDSAAQFLGYPAQDDSQYFNFWEGTGGRATLKLDDLKNSLLSTIDIVGSEIPAQKPADTNFLNQSPQQVNLNEATTFSFTGTNLFGEPKLTPENGNCSLLTFTSQKWEFSCIFNKLGNNNYTFSGISGYYPSSYSVYVVEKGSSTTTPPPTSTPTVSGIMLSTNEVRNGDSFNIFVRGSNLPTNLALSFKDNLGVCTNNGGDSTQSQFNCTANQAGKLRITIEPLSTYFDINVLEKVIVTPPTTVTTNEQCATFQPTLSKVTIPCVNVMGTMYSVDLKQVSIEQGLRFSVDMSSLKSTQLTGESCGVYPYNNLPKLRLNCVDVSGTKYWATLNQVPSSTNDILFDLENAGLR